MIERERATTRRDERRSTECVTNTLSSSWPGWLLLPYQSTDTVRFEWCVIRLGSDTWHTAAAATTKGIQFPSPQKQDRFTRRVDHSLRLDRRRWPCLFRHKISSFILKKNKQSSSKSNDFFHVFHNFYETKTVPPSWMDNVEGHEEN